MGTDYENLLKENGILVFVPSGESMWPTLKDKGQSVVIMPKKDKPKKWDVVFYKRPNGQYVLHRIVDVFVDEYVLCGDNHLEYEYGITDNMIIGYMAGYYKGKKFVETKGKKGSRLAIFLHKHRFIKRVYTKLFYRRKLADNER